jgi:DNA repair photolyase
MAIRNKKERAEEIKNRALTKGGAKMKRENEVVGSNGKRITGVKEWCHFTINCYAGCENSCAYCYAQAQKIQYNSKKLDPNKMLPQNRHIPVKREWKRIVSSLRTGQREYGPNSTIMAFSTHDITPQTIDYCLETIKFILDDERSNHRVLIVTKPRFECVKQMCEELKGYKDRVLFRFTIGSSDDAILKFWEPNASSYAERLKSLEYAFKMGFDSSVSCEPSIDNNTDAVIEAVLPYVTDGIWVGRPNKFKRRLELNGCDDTEHLKRAEELLLIHSDEAIKKRYEKWKSNPKLRWKDEVKKVVGLPSNPRPGMDI